MNSDQFLVTFQPSGRGKAQCAPDPKFPKGKAIPAPGFYRELCQVNLPYPAPECGVHFVRCTKCNTVIGVTAAGRPDDPISVQIPCSNEANAKAQAAMHGTVRAEPGDVA